MNNNNSESPLISVVIPTYNRCDLLAEALRSVVSQTYSNWELLVIDDGSTEPIEEVVKAFSDQRIIYHRQMNQGVSVARNLGIQLAKGKYIAFLDSDDMMEPICLDEKIKLVKENPDVGVVGGGCRYVNYEGEPILNISPARDSITYEDLSVWTAFPGGTCNIFAERELLVRIGGFRTNLVDSEDRDLLRRLVEMKPFASVKNTTAVIRSHSSPRINRDISALIYCRRWVSKQINDPKLRKVSSAWDEHVFGVKKWQSGARFSAIIHWLHSFLIHPASLRPELQRMREIGRLLLR